MRPLLGLLLLAACLITPAVARAASSDTPVTLIIGPTDRDADIARVIKALRAQGNSVVVRIQGTDANKPAVSVQPETPPPMMAQMLDGMTGQAMRRQLAEEVQAVGEIPATFHDVASAWANAPGAASGADGLRVLAVVLAAVLAAAVGHARLRRLLRHKTAMAPQEFRSRLGAVATCAVVDGAALLLAFAAGQATIAAFLPTPGIAQMLGGELLAWFLTVGAYWLLGRILVSPQLPASRLMPLPHADWHFGMFVVYGVLGYTIWFIGHFVGQISSNRAGVAALILVAGAVVTVFKLVWFWTGRRDITAALTAFRPAGKPPGLLRRVEAAAWPYVLIVVALLIFVTSQLSLNSPRFAELGRAAGLTQILIFLLPALVGGVDAALYDIAARQPAHWHPVRRALPSAARTLLLSVLWLGGLFIVIRTWSGFFVDMEGRSVTGVLYTVALVATILILGLTTWVFLRTVMDSYAGVHHRVAMPGGDDDVLPVESRLGTVLPLVRGLILGTVVAVTALMALSSLQVNIAPLLAGAGVIGLAISFGSQALIRDVMSGIFFMADDAFRVGEYIDTGRLRGTVEKITLRSAQLRHQNGQVHTVPFGQLVAVTNFSRDWSTVKFTIRLEHGTDLERARKVVKKVGLELLQDPELGGDFILPLKLQGVSEITDTALVVRLKFTAKPVRPTWLQREAMKRVYVALRAAGIAFASGAVTVRSASSAADPRDAAAVHASSPQAMPMIAAQ